MLTVSNGQHYTSEPVLYVKCHSVIGYINHAASPTSFLGAHGISARGMFNFF
jgi:hypothetical protein